MTTKEDVLRLRDQVNAKETELRNVLLAAGHSDKDPIVIMALLVMVQTSLAFGTLKMEQTSVEAKKILLGVSEDFKVKEMS